MKRSEINQKLREAIKFIDGMNFMLPPFAFWTPEKWERKGQETDEIRVNQLGWDITDFGSGNFDRVGLLLFTLRNGSLTDGRYPKTYAEKLMIVEEEQLTPLHFHWNKMEDIINRGGGNLIVQIYNATADERLEKSPVHIAVDGQTRKVDAGTLVTLTPGESITLPPRLYHKFWGQKGCGAVLLGEVSMVNDDRTDNRFYEPVGRFPVIEDDEAPLYLLCNEYPKAQ